MKTSELLARLEPNDRGNAHRDLWRWAGRYLDREHPGSGVEQDDWTERDLIVLRLLVDCQRDNVIDPTRAKLVDVLKACPEGTEMISVVSAGGLWSYYKPRWT